MTKHLTMPVHTPWFQGPLFYPDAEMIQVIFTPTAESYQRILPKPLSPGLLGGVYLVHYKTSPFGPVWEAAVLVQCTYKEHFGLYCISMFIDNDASVAAHREIWGFPAKIGQFKYKRDGNRIKAQVLSNKIPLMKFDIKLTGPGEWIDTGAAINLKLIPSVDGKGYDVNQITAADLEFTIHEGEAGDGKITFGHTDDEPLDELIQLENVVAGTWFRIDLTCPFGYVIGEAEL